MIIKVIEAYPEIEHQDPIVVSCSMCAMTLWFISAYMDDKEYLLCKGCAKQEDPTIMTEEISP